MAGKILDNGALVTLGLVAAVAAVGAANKAGLYGSRAQRSSTAKTCPGCGSVITFIPPSFTECGTLCPVRDFVSDLKEHGRAVAIREWKAAGNRGPIPTQKKIEAVEAAHDTVARAGARMRHTRADHYIVRPIRNGTEWAVFYADQEDLLPGEGMTHAAAVKSAKRLAAERGARWRDFGDEVYAPSYDYTA